MNVLLVSNEYTKPGRIGNPIINRLIDALRVNEKVTSVEFVPFMNSFKSFGEIRRASKSVDIIHVQFGGLYAFLVWLCLIGVSKPKLLTFHGTDIHAKEMLTAKSVFVKLKIWLNQKASFCSILMFNKLGFVSETLLDYVPQFIIQKYKNKMFIQSLGVDYNVFTPMDKDVACKELGIENKKWVLFSDKSNTILKRRDIAEAIIKELGQGYELLIMCGVKPNEVPVYVNSCEFVILTSDEEGSPNITREALSLNKRVFSVDVGDVKSQIKGLKNSAIISRNPSIAAETIREHLSETYTDNSRSSLRSQIDFAYIAHNLVDKYEQLLLNRK